MTEDRVPTPRRCPDCDEPIIDVAHWHEDRAMTEDRVPTICAACGGTDEPVVNVPLHPRCAAQPAPPLRLPYSDKGDHPRHRTWRCRFDGPHEGRCEPMLLIGYPDPKQPAPPLDVARQACIDIMLMAVDHLDDRRLRLIHKAAQRGAEMEARDD